MREEFIFRKYGDDGKKRFYDTFSLCIFMNDTDIIGEYWESMKTTEKKKWQETPNEITDLEKFFTSKYFKREPGVHKYFNLDSKDPKNYKRNCCDYCDLLLCFKLKCKRFKKATVCLKKVISKFKKTWRVRITSTSYEF